MDDVYGLYMYALETWYLLLAQEEDLLLVEEDHLLVEEDLLLEENHLLVEEDLLLVEDEMSLERTFFDIFLKIYVICWKKIFI